MGQIPLKRYPGWVCLLVRDYVSIPIVTAAIGEAFKGVQRKEKRWDISVSFQNVRDIT